jgi:hypothetical protein
MMRVRIHQGILGRSATVMRRRTRRRRKMMKKMMLMTHSELQS